MGVSEQFDQMQRKARSQWQSSEAGRLVRQVERLSRRRGRDVDRQIRTNVSRLVSMASAAGKQTTPELDAIVGTIARYARGSLRDRMVSTVLGSLGPLGSLVAQVISAGAQGRRSSGGGYGQREFESDLSAALAMVGAFAPDLLSEEGKRQAGVRIPPGFKPAEGEQPEHLRGTTPRRQAEAELVGGVGDGRWTSIPIGGRRRMFLADDPIVTGAMIPVSSSNVHSIGYLLDFDNPDQSALQVRFLQSRGRGRPKGAGPLYYYYGVGVDVFQSFRRAASKGEFVWDELRVRGSITGHQYHYELKGITNGYVPRKAQRFGPNEYFIRREIRATSQRTGQTRAFRSALPDERARGKPERGTPNRGRPSRGR